MARGRVIVITGAMAAGKSTVAELVAARPPLSVHLRGDTFRRMIVNGRRDMGREAGEEAVRQLRLRYRLTANAADSYACAGFDVVIQDVIIGSELPGFLALLNSEHRYLIVLAPSASTLADREGQRVKIGYTGFTPAELDHVLRTETPRIGYWLDSTGQTPQQSADTVIDHLEDALI